LVTRLVTDSDIIGFFTDPELRTLNPGVRFPGVLSDPLLRAERNADTRLLTTWMSRQPDSKTFLADEDPWGVPVNASYRGYHYPKDNFENVAQSGSFLPRQGEGPVALRLFYGVRPTGAVSESTRNVGFVGIADLPTARRFGLPTAKIVNAAGKAVAPTDDAILAGFRNMKVARDDTLVADAVTTDPDAYPLVKVDYAMVPTQPSDAGLATDLTHLLHYVAGDGQDVLPPGYVALPKSLRNQTRAVADQLGAPPPSPTTTTTTVPGGATTTTFTPFAGGAGSGSFTSTGGGSSTGGGTPPGGGGAARGGTATGGNETAVPAAAQSVASLTQGRARLFVPALLTIGVVALLAWTATSPRISKRKRKATA
jgi:hypothetical protein